MGYFYFDKGSTIHVSFKPEDLREPIPGTCDCCGRKTNPYIGGVYIKTGKPKWYYSCFHCDMKMALVLFIAFSLFWVGVWIVGTFIGLLL